MMVLPRSFYPLAPCKFIPRRPESFLRLSIIVRVCWLLVLPTGESKTIDRLKKVL